LNKWNIKGLSPRGCQILVARAKMAIIMNSPSTNKSMDFPILFIPPEKCKTYQYP
jgi:hypothetical protein